ncbi:hypothetical protein AB0I34_08040 [Kribbella sp. NPDC050281]
MRPAKQDERRTLRGLSKVLNPRNVRRLLLDVCTEAAATVGRLRW